MATSALLLTSTIVPAHARMCSCGEARASEQEASRAHVKCCSAAMLVDDGNRFEAPLHHTRPRANNVVHMMKLLSTQRQKLPSPNYSYCNRGGAASINLTKTAGEHGSEIRERAKFMRVLFCSYKKRSAVDGPITSKNIPPSRKPVFL